MQKVRFGIVGFGLHAVKRLMPGFRTAEHCEVTALSRRDAAKAKQSAAEYGIPQWFTSAAELAASPEVDAVFVTTPNCAHLDDVLAAVKHRKPVLVEKPMAMNAGECREMIAAAKSAGVLLGVAQVFRFTNSLRRIREIVQSGELGQVLFARSEFSYPAVGHGRTWIADRAIAGGGPVMDVGVHCVDALRFVLKQEVRSVAAFAQWDERWPEVEAAASLLLNFYADDGKESQGGWKATGGTAGVVLVSARTAYRTPIELVGSEGVLRVDDGLNVERPIRIELWRDGKLARAQEVNNAGAYARQVDAFALALRGEAGFPAPGEEGLRNQLVLDAAYRSMESGSAVELE